MSRRPKAQNTGAPCGHRTGHSGGSHWGPQSSAHFREVPGAGASAEACGWWGSGVAEKERAVSADSREGAMEAGGLRGGPRGRGGKTQQGLLPPQEERSGEGLRSEAGCTRHFGGLGLPESFPFLTTPDSLCRFTSLLSSLGVEPGLAPALGSQRGLSSSPVDHV